MKNHLSLPWLLYFILLSFCTQAQDKRPLRDSSITYRNSLKTAFKQTNDLKKLIGIVRESIYLFDEIKLNPKESEEVLKFYLTEVQAKRKTDKILPYIQNGLGFVYYLIPEASMLAGDYFLNSLEQIKATQDLEWISRTYQFVGTIFYNIGDYEGAITYFSLYAQNVHKIPLDKGLIISSYNTMALIFQKTEKIDSALVYFNKALQASYVQKNRLWEGIVKGNIGSIYYNQKRYEEALPLLQKDVEISLEYKLYANAVLSLSDVILIHLAQKNYAEAQNSLLRCDTLLKKIEWIAVDIRAYAKFYETSAIYYETLQAYEQASRYRRLYEDADKAYRKYIKDIDIQRIKFRYNYELKQRDIEKLTEKAALQQTYLYIIGFALATVILMIIVLVQRFYQKNVLMARLRTQNEQIKQNNEQLLLNMEQITQQTQMIESQNQALYASNLSKDKIFSLISHDLRSPLARLKGIVGLLQDDLLSIAELQKILPALENNLDSTLNLTEELLYWAKSQIGGLQVHPTLLNPSLIVQQTIDYLQKTAEAKGILLSKGSLLDLPVVWADENMIKAVLRNLINNAIKFSNKNESIIITADYESHDTVLFMISDTGIGIKPEIVETMFKKELVRSTQGTAGEKGTGFGLTLCKDFVVQNGGRIWVKSTWGEGSEFCFTLPVVTANLV